MQQVRDFEDWRAACRWVANSGTDSARARFLTPRLAQTFKWYTGHSRRGHVEGRAAGRPKASSSGGTAFRTSTPRASTPPEPRWHESLAELGPGRLRQLGAKYDADYVITGSDRPAAGA